MALRLSKALGNSATLWLNLQRDYDLWQAKQLHKNMHVEKIEAAA